MASIKFNPKVENSAHTIVTVKNGKYLDRYKKIKRKLIVSVILNILLLGGTIYYCVLQ